MGDRLHNLLLALVISFGAIHSWTGVAAAGALALINIGATVWATREELDA